MIGPENSPGFVVRTEAQKAAWGQWLPAPTWNQARLAALTTAPGSVWMRAGNPITVRPLDPEPASYEELLAFVGREFGRIVMTSPANAATTRMSWSKAFAR
jgi:hypothetical protein